MGRLRISTRGLIVAVAVVGFDVAAMTRAVKLGRAAHSVREYAIGFGLVLLVLNLVVLGLLAALSKKAGVPKGGRLNMTPSPLVILGFYVAVLAVAILSVLFLTSGRF
jgi:cytochrome b561